jgi:hypothetical protein
MRLKIAAIRSGSEPAGKLPGGAFHRWLETPLACPRCDVTYNLVADWDQANDRWFAEESGALIQRLRKAVMMGHSAHHRVTHYETSGVTVVSITPSESGKST